MFRLSRQLCAAACAIVVVIMGLSAAPVGAQTIIDEWSSAKLPPPPQLKPAKIEAPRETAVLVMDLTNQTCTKERRPRCAASVGKVSKLVAAARDKGALIIYSVPGANATATDVLKELTPASGETVLPPLGPDKFIDGELDKMLKQRGIKTLIVLGTQAQTSVLHTGATAALKGFKVVVPVDAMSSDDSFPELYTAWHLANAARIGPQVTLTTTEMIAF
jgi:nicotinamidase-related amidase